MRRLNPFSSEYAIKESKKFPDYFHLNSVTIQTRVLQKGQRIRNYLYLDVMAEQDIKFKVFKINGDLWMSTTPLEMASHWIPIQKAKGKVAVGGCGMGYYLLSIMGLKRVKQIDVYESERDVICYFNCLFKNRKGFDKINFIEGDMFDNLNGKEYDFFYNDIYLELGSEKAELDTLQLVDINTFHDWWFWGMELSIYECFAERKLAPIFITDKVVLKFFEMYCQIGGFRVSYDNLECPVFVKYMMKHAY